MPRRNKQTKQDAMMNCIAKCHDALRICYNQWNVNSDDMSMVLAVLTTLHGHQNIKLNVTVERT